MSAVIPIEMAPSRTAAISAFQREAVNGLWQEVVPLLESHWREIAHYPDIKLNPDIEAYNTLESKGLLRCYTARVNGVLVGYAVYVVRGNPHYLDSLQAVQDVLFVLPEYRQSRIGIRLIKFSDEQLAGEGVQVVMQHVKVAHDFGPLLERLGYEKVEYIFSKRLDRREGDR